MPDKPFVRQQMSDDALQKTLRKKTLRFQKRNKEYILSDFCSRGMIIASSKTQKKLYNMETLKEKLGKLSLPWKKDEKTKLEDQFKELAPFFLSGGYIKVREDYRVYPTTIEFYFHSEKEDGIKDPIVYHRDNNKVQGKIPYFPIMTLHAHDSGYDITFENPKEEYRASVLIREYQIWDIHNYCWLKWNTATQQFSQAENNDYKNKQVLYLKYILNSFVIGGCSCIEWVDASMLLKVKKGITDGTYRQNVSEFKKDANGNYIIDENLKYIKEDPVENAPTPLDKTKYFRYSEKIYNLCQRKWSFSRENPIE